MGFNSPDNKLASLRSKRCSIEDLQIKYEAPSPAKTSSRWKKSKVKQLSCLFNTKISQIIKREGDVGKYTPLINEFSPEAKTQPIQKCPKLEPMPRKKFIKPKAPVPTPRKKVIANMQPKSSACFVPEDVFSKLSVKDKALFYTKFVEEMTKKNPKFGVMESQGNRIINKSEVIEEKQVSVKNLLDELEFNSVFPKPTAVAANAIQRMDSMKRACAARRRSLQMSKEFEDILQQQETTIQTQCTSLTTSSANETSSSSSSSSANNDQNQTIFQNVQIETLFYSWLKEKHDNDAENMENEAEIHDDEKQKTIIDTLLEEAIAQLETEETAKVPIPMPRKLPIAKLNDQTESPSTSAAKAPEVEAQANLNDNSPSIAAAKTSVAEAQANPNENSSSIAAGKTSEAKAQAKLSDNSTSTSSAKPSETEESESGVSSLPKITSEESQPENAETKTIKSENSFEFAKPLVPARKKKWRRNTAPKKDVSEKEVPQTTSTDSDSGGKQTEAKLKNKKLTSPNANRKDIALHYEEQPCLEMNQSFFKSLNSPRKIKSVYTLTINDLDTPVCTPRSSLNLAKQQRESGIFTVPTKKRTLSDSLTDQGFETATNDAESSLKKTVLQETAETQTPLSSSLDNKTIHVQESTKTDACSPAKTTVVQEKAKTQAPAAAAPTPTTLKQTTTIKAPEPAPAKVLEKAASLDKIDSNSSKYSMVYSTPIKTPEQHTFTPKRLFSPIVKAMKNRRKSFYDIEARRSSLAMQVIREDQPLETLESQQPTNRYSNAEQELFAKPSTIKYANNFKEFPKDKISQFWIKCGDFSVSLDIDYVGNRRLQTLYEIFSQNNDDTKDLHFGIDNNKFSIHEPLEMDNISTRIPSCQECSHYWFSTGELTIPFNGKILPPHKIQRLFRALKETVLETGVLRFGVDAIEFSSVPEFWYQQAKFSVGSQYNMLVGLQSGESDGLEGRSKYAWPHTKPVMISDLDHSDIETDNYEDDDYAHFSFHPFASNHFDLAALGETELAIPRNSVAMMNLETYCGEYENEPLDQLFDDKCHEEEEEQEEVEQPAPEQAEIKSVPHMIHVMENEKQRLSDVKAQLSNCAQSSSYIAKDALDAYKGTPAYVEKLKDIVADISNIVCSNNIDACSIDELENYLYFLSRYAEICLSTCDKHIDTVLSALPPENELQKSHDHNPAALSEHQLRIQASLQRLNIPDWFRQYNQNQKSPDGAGTGASTYKPGNFTRKRTQDSGRWVGLNSKTTSLSSLGSQRSDRSPLLLSPSAHSHHGGQSTQHAGQPGHATVTGTTANSGAFSRWSTSHLNSSQTSPSVSQRGSFSRGGPINSSFISVNSGNSVIRNSMRQPYLGWRSQEKLSQRTAHERLASSLLSQQQRTSPTTHTVPANNDKLQTVTPEIQSSIKEVTSAIVHYVNDQTNQQRSRSTSPNSRKCWLESSFVGTRPLDSPQTPTIENTPLITAAQAAAVSSASLTTLRPSLLNNNINNNNNHLQYVNHNIDESLNLSILTGNDIQLTRMNGGLNNGTSSSSAGGVNLGVERSLSNASLEDVLASLLGLPTHPTGANASDAYARSSTGGVLVSESQTPAKQQQQQQNQHHMPQNPQPLQQQQQLQNQQSTKENFLVISKEEQQRLRRRSEGDAATKQKQQQQQQPQQEQQQQQFEQKSKQNAKAYASDSITSITNTSTTANGHAGGTTTFLPPRRVSLGDSSESNNRTASASGELQIKCRNNKCDRTATPADAKKYYKSCHNCTYLYCSRECRRAHWEKHRKACLHSRVSNLCRQVLASCKDDSDSLRHLSLLARKGFLSQGRGVVRILFRSPESAEGFIKNGFQCMGEASYVRWPDLMPAEMGLELYSELLKLSTEYRPDSKMLVYVAVCVVSEAPGMGQAPVRWERQLVSRCAKLKICKTVLAELEQQQQPLPQPVTVVAVPEPTTEVLILTFNPQLRNSTAQRELVLSNILDILSRRGVILRKHYPEIFQRLQTYTEGQTDKFNPVTLHPRDSHTGQNFVCIIMPVQSETEIIKLPSIADGGNRVTTIDVGSSAALAQLDDDELLTRTAS